MTLRDFMQGHATAEITCLYTKRLVRKLSVAGDTITVDAMIDTVDVPLDTEIVYEPWAFDRGSLMFNAPGFGKAKLCTEFDTVKFPDGSEWSADQTQLTDMKEVS